MSTREMQRTYRHGTMATGLSDFERWLVSESLLDSWEHFEEKEDYTSIAAIKLALDCLGLPWVRLERPQGVVQLT